MDLYDALRARRMVRAYQRREVDRAVVDRVLGAGLRAPSAGNTSGTDFVVLEGYEQTSRYWDVCLPVERRASFRWQGLLDAPVLILPVAHAGAYLARYAEPDKEASGLGLGEDRWPVPYWQIDTAMAAMGILLAATAEGLGALFFGIFRGERDLLAALHIPDGHRPIGTIALGHPALDEPGRSAGRTRRGADEMVHRGGW